MPRITAKNIHIPCDVPASRHTAYVANFLLATRHTGRLMLFAGDQKIEHLNDDFYASGSPGPSAIALDDNDPEHLFRIASQACIGVFATQLGLINRYGRDYPDITYLAKLNSKSHLVKTSQQEPLSRVLWSVEDVLRAKEASSLNIVGVGYTCYLGSEHESEMLAEAAQVIHQAHQHGLIAVIWMYPRGKAVPNEKEPHLIAGACGVAVCLGADFVKVNYPEAKQPARALQEAVAAAGRTGVICAGGKTTDAAGFLQQLHEQIHVSGALGNATGRNIHQRSLREAVQLCNAISAITLADYEVAQALQVYRGEADFTWGVNSGV